ncbi:hypothetical protein ARMGADRAFT_1030838 [Armillaria gallica]|uniref:Uncharacterized protein n=1 Tax=Armillaria gallica TaxID=47427 RepID=A0A2H3DYN6_ARMGA|nr:hypothetical protein ARMGADRAFT_1030838 [Armillaria gallica]
MVRVKVWLSILPAAPWVWLRPYVLWFCWKRLWLVVFPSRICGGEGGWFRLCKAWAAQSWSRYMHRSSSVKSTARLSNSTVSSWVGALLSATLEINEDVFNELSDLVETDFDEEKDDGVVEVLFVFRPHAWVQALERRVMEGGDTEYAKENDDLKERKLIQELTAPSNAFSSSLAQFMQFTHISSFFPNINMLLSGPTESRPCLPSHWYYTIAPEQPVFMLEGLFARSQHVGVDNEWILRVTSSKEDPFFNKQLLYYIEVNPRMLVYLAEAGVKETRHPLLEWKVSKEPVNPLLPLKLWLPAVLVREAWLDLVQAYEELLALKAHKREKSWDKDKEEESVSKVRDRD